MKIKNIMLITFLLLAVLTIGAVSASEDVASENITVSDDADVIASVDDYDPYDDYSITIEEEESICIDPENDNDEYDDEAEIAWLEVDTDTPEDIKGSFQIWKDNEKLVHLDIDLDDEHWDYDEDIETLTGTVFLKDLNLNKINNGDILSFKYFEAGKTDPVDSLTVLGKVTISEQFMKLIDIEAEYEDVEADYTIDESIIMNEGWEENELVEFTVREGLEGRIVIYLNETLSFNKTLSDVANELDEYIVLLGDLNIKQPGKYIITCYFYDNEGIVKYNSTINEDEAIIITLYEPQTETVNNVTITVSELPIPITGNETLITIDSTASEDDEITISIEGKEPITIKLNETNNRDDDGNYLIGSKELKLPLAEGQYVLNITYKGKNITNKKINLISNIVINFEDEPVYYKFDDGFVFISLEEGIIAETSLEGKINLTIIDKAGNIIDTIEKDIDQIKDSYDEDEDARVIYTEDLNKPLNGTYTVVVRYFDGNEAATQNQCEMTFKTLTAKDYGASINEIIKNNNDTVITFTDLPLDYITIEIDGELIDNPLYLEELNNQEGEYYITYDKLKNLTEGLHSISVYLEYKNERIDLVNGTILVDLKENIDPALSINVASIEEGNDVLVFITTNETFTGKVTLQVANTTYTVNVTKGQGNISIAGLKVANYNATAFFTSNGIFNDSAKTTTFNVTAKPATPVPTNTTPSKEEKQPVKKKNVIKLTLKKVKIKKSTKKLVLKATLKINGKKVKGKKITFKFKGKTYKAKTKKNGVAKVTIKKKVLKKLKVGKKVTYTAKYSNKKVKKTVKVRK